MSKSKQTDSPILKWLSTKNKNEDIVTSSPQHDLYKSKYKIVLIGFLGYDKKHASIVMLFM